MADGIHMLMDYFIYSEGNVKGLIICCLISLCSFLLFIMTFIFGKPKAGTEKARNKGNVQ